MSAAAYRFGAYGLAIVAGIFAFSSHAGDAGDAVHWTYAGATGPEHGSELSESFSM